jgi:ketosteroid isomerase-like protein
MEFKDAVRNIWDTYAGTMNDGDLDRWIGLWEDDGIQMPPNCPSRKGTSAILAAMRTDFRDYDLRKFTVVQGEAVADGGLGFSSGTYTYMKVRKSDAHSAAIDGKFLTVFKRRPDGSWKILRDCFNANNPPA